VLLDKHWTTAFAALGKKPTGWTTFIPSNFVVGSFAVALFCRRSTLIGLGTRSLPLSSWRVGQPTHHRIWQEQLHWIMVFCHDVRDPMQEDNRPTFVGVVRFKIEIGTREKEMQCIQPPVVGFRNQAGDY
jgi:hypothetical protein